MPAIGGLRHTADAYDTHSLSFLLSIICLLKHPLSPGGKMRTALNRPLYAMLFRYQQTSTLPCTVGHCFVTSVQVHKGTSNNLHAQNHLYTPMVIPPMHPNQCPPYNSSIQTPGQPKKACATKPQQGLGIASSPMREPTSASVFLWGHRRPGRVSLPATATVGSVLSVVSTA